jgi:hypothetical protein
MFRITFYRLHYYYGKWSKVHNDDQSVLIFYFKDEQTQVYIYVQNNFAIGQVHVVLKLLIKRLAVAMVNTTVHIYVHTYRLTWQ